MYEENLLENLSENNNICIKNENTKKENGIDINLDKEQILKYQT